jgi:hypothetical protein
MTPAQTLEAGKIAVSGDPLAAGLDGEGSKMGIRGQWAAGPALATQARKDSPMADTRTYDDAVRSVEQYCSEGKRFVEA